MMHRMNLLNVCGRDSSTYDHAILYTKSFYGLRNIFISTITVMSETGE